MATYDSQVPKEIQTLIHDDFESVYVQFLNPDGEITAVESPNVTIRNSRYDPNDPQSMVVSGAAMSDYYTELGLYKYQLNPAQLDAGVYDLTFLGTLSSGTFQNTDVSLPVTLVMHGSMSIAEGTPEIDLRARIRRKLKDLNVELYRLDLPIRKWSDEEITENIDQALMTINSTGPRLTDYTASNIGNGATFIIDLAYAQCVESYATLEIANTATMSDGTANLTINRAQAYQQLSREVFSRVLPRIEKWKNALVPRMHGQGGNPYPFRLRNMVAYWPNSKNVF